MNSEDILRIEHKLDAILWYLRELTGIPAKEMPKPIFGSSGKTDGVCPITDTDIYYNMDVHGKVRRQDGLNSGTQSINPLPTQTVVTITRHAIGAKDDDNH